MAPKFGTIGYLKKKKYMHTKPPFLTKRGTNMDVFSEFTQEKRTEVVTPGGRSPSQGTTCLSP